MTHASGVKTAPAMARNRKPARAMQAILLGVTVGILAPVFSGPAMAAGFFETLFGVRQAQQPIYAPRPQYDVPLVSSAQGSRIKAAQRAKAKSSAKTVKGISAAKSAAAGLKTTAPRVEVLPGPLGPFLRDPTLRRGDVVVTTDGLKVFTGAANTQHASTEFSALSRASQFAAGNSNVLAAIDRANRLSTKPLVEVQAIPVTPVKATTKADRAPAVESSPAPPAAQVKPAVRAAL